MEWQWFIEEFGTVVLSKEVFFSMINVIDEQKLIDLSIQNFNYHSIRIINILLVDRLFWNYYLWIQTLLSYCPNFILLL
jgi:hypothetical protein